ncbi:biotin transporter BioY [Marininema halotolerans]|uniref:Biotin transporter n=1 Tax=Marininema halotolerans TaxID=1155944 RepID=A0A1I6PYH6_9BACL|nr:biotin transporter BioY [Marininema halotolerans]SFS45168.1 biotin transport system substrate-specific component [Marininema halotolerans]
MSKRTRSVRDMILIALFTALIAIAGQIYIPLTVVPITLQTMIVLLAGSVLGARKGAMSMVVLILLVAVGAPVLSEGKSGLPALVGPTAGYIWSWPIAAFLIGWITERIAPQLRVWKMVLVHLFAGSIIIFAFGISWLHFMAGLDWGKAVAVGLLPFIPGDVAKLLLASFIAPALYRAYPIIQPRKAS